MNRQFIYEYTLRYDVKNNTKEKKLTKHKVLAETRDRIALQDCNYEFIEPITIINNNRNDSIQSDYEFSLEKAKGGQFKIGSCEEIWAKMYSSSKENKKEKFEVVQSELNRVIQEKYTKVEPMSFSDTKMISAG